jgi:long-chain acyl-CoA synthetase
MNIATNLSNAALHFPDRTAATESERRMTFAELEAESNRIAAGLTLLGLRPGDYAALCAPNSLRWIAFYFGVIKAGAAAATFSHLLAPRELTAILGDCRPRILFTTDEKLDALGGRHPDEGPAHIVCDHGNISYPKLLAKGDAGFKTVDRDREDTAAILYTGGTTGTPKGAMLSHANIQAAVFNVAHFERSTEADTALCFLPLNHVFAQIHIMLATVFSAGALVIQPGFDQDLLLDALQRRKVTKLYAVPTIYIRLLRLQGLRERLCGVRYCFSAAASMARDTVRAWQEVTGLNIHEAYGMTESASMVTYNHYYRHVVGSVGTPANLVELRICDSGGRPLETGDSGEICIRGPNVTGRGYLNSPAETRAAFHGAWFRSGDVGYLDDAGYLFIVDRLKDMIVTGGENVYPREIEELLYTRSDIQECAVVGLPDPEYGERVTAFLVSNAESKPGTAELQTYLKRRLAGFKVPKEFRWVSELPKNNAGKLLKREIRRKWAGT